MIINLPGINGENNSIEDKRSIVLIGANGSGKTRMSLWIEEHNKELRFHRISAQKSLNMPERVSPTEMTMAEELLRYGSTNNNKSALVAGKNYHRWGARPATHLLNDFKILMEYLMTENYEKSIEFREKHKSGDNNFDNNTKLERIKEIWENVITHRKMKIAAGKIEIDKKLQEGDQPGNSTPYNGSEMSDGERAIFYFIGEILSAPDNSVVIIDEPENHLHKSISIRLWNAIEAAKPECAFVYISHSLDFACSRLNSQIIWVKDMPKENEWNYELLTSPHSSDELMVEMLGNRQNILLVEGTQEKSYDRKLYSVLFPEYNVIPVNNCGRVIDYTKAYVNLNTIHYNIVKGIIDRDRRSQEILDLHKTFNIFSPEVAEIENLFLLPELIEFIAKKQDKQDKAEEIISAVKTKTIEFLTKEKESQALLFTKQKVNNKIYEIINDKTASIEEYKENIRQIKDKVDIDPIHSEIQAEIQKIIDDQDFLSALKIINNKGLLPYTELSSHFGWRKNYYIDYVISLLNSPNNENFELKKILKKYIVIE